MDNKKGLLEVDEKKQEEQGRIIDEFRKHSEWLKEHKEKLKDPKYILYRLPLTHKQRDELFNKLMLEEKKLIQEEEEKKTIKQKK